MNGFESTFVCCRQCCGGRFVSRARRRGPRCVKFCLIATAWSVVGYGTIQSLRAQTENKAVDSANSNAPSIRAIVRESPLQTVESISTAIHCPMAAVIRLGTIRMRQEGHSRMSVSYSFNGKILASTDGDGIILWDAATGSESSGLYRTTSKLMGGNRQLMRLPFPRARISWPRYGDGTLICWDLVTGKRVLMEAIKPADDRLPLGLAEYCGLDYSPDGGMLAVNWGGKTTVFETSFGRILQSIGTTGDNLQFGLAWSPDSSQLAQGAHEAVARLCKLSDGEARDFKADVEAFALSLTISPDGKTLAGGCVQNKREQIMICLWDLETGKLKASLPSEDAVSLHFTPDGKTLVSATEKGTIDIWDVEQAVKRRSIAAGLGHPAAFRGAFA